MKTISGIKASLDSKQETARSIVERALADARSSDSFHALLSLTEERALERADAVDRGEITGRLAGVPFVVKDNFLAFGGPTTAASHMLESFQAPFQASAVERLEGEGAICIGKANLDAFAHGGSTENSAFGPTKNPDDASRVAGGSSGGSAASVALGIVPFALGSDTGGSIRQPASFNGVVGLKPTYGTVSRFGVVAMASSTDVVGPITSNVADAELLMEILSGKDDRDATTLPDFYQSLETPGEKLRIGLIKEFMDEGVDEQVRAAITAYADKARSLGHSVEEVNLPMVKYTLAMYYIIVPAEISSNLARYDGIRYGHRSDSATSLSEVYGQSREYGFEVENKRRILIGSYVLSSGFFDAYYLQAQKARTLLIQEFDALFKDYDALLGPVAPTPAFKLGENSSDPIKMYLADVMSVPASLAGLPALSVPAGVSKEALPIGAQLIARRRDDAQLLALARQIEEAA